MQEVRIKKPKVYFTKEITPTKLKEIFEILGRELKGSVAVKISTGEPGGHHYLKPELIGELVSSLNGTIVECNTAYKGKRFNTKDHMEAVKLHGFNKIAPVEILDAKGEISLPIGVSGHLQGENFVGKGLEKYNSMLVLSHFKGHAMGGFGGALKNISIGLASKNGKAWIHSAGFTKDVDVMWGHVDNQDAFLESMAEASKSVIDYLGRANIVYINVANNLSVDCDCDNNPAPPEIDDIGIFASVDPVAIDQACYDAIINLSDPRKKSFTDRMEEKHAIHLVEWAEKLGLGERNYQLVEI